MSENMVNSRKITLRFFLMVKSDEKKSYNFYLNKLRSIPFILTANHVVVEQLKSKENLIF